MAINSKIEPVGVDIWIDKIQSILWDKLTWKDVQYESFHRAYKNKDGNKLIPEVYCGSGEYEEVFLQDKYSAMSYFLVGNTRTLVGNQNKLDVSIYFHVILDELYPAIGHRADEEAHREVINALINNPLLDVEAIVVGIEDVYGKMYNDSIKYDDIHPYHVFRLDMELSFNYSQCCKDC